MSITGSTEPISKRRKLSHAAATEAQDEAETQHGSEVDRLDVPSNEASLNPQAVYSASVNKKMRSTAMTHANGITKSSLLQLQINDLLEEIRPDYDDCLRKIKPVSEKLVRAIRSIPEQPALSLSEDERTLRKQYGIAIPFTAYRPSTDTKYKFEYKAPAHIDLRGSLVRHAGMKGDLTLEFAIQMPPEVFQEKDYLNHRALHKRAYYTACLVGGLREKLGADFDFEYHLHNGNDLVPVITLIPVNAEILKATQNVTLTVNVMLPNDIGPIEKLLPTCSCVRKGVGDHVEGGGQALPSPLYNSTIRELASSQTIDRLLEQTANSCDSFADACLLGQVWLQQRGCASDLSHGGFGAVEWAYMSALLLKSGGHRGHPLFSDRYSSLQLFRAMLQVLANRDLTDPLIVNSPELRLSKTELPVLYDGERGINVLAKMSIWSYDYLKHQAQISLASINAKTPDSFDSSFIIKVAEKTLFYDEVYTIDLGSANNPSSGRLQDTLSTLYTILKRGLGDRVTLLDLRQNLATDWKLTSDAPTQSKAMKSISLCLLLNADSAGRLIDHGPTAEETEAAKEFREFWGDKSELRRFRDGSITETLVWSSESSAIMQIMRHLTALHLGLPPSSICGQTPDLQTERLSSEALVSAEDGFKIVNSKYQDLSSKLHQMDGLPLPIRSVSPIGQALRSASIGHPLDPATSVPIDILIQFDSSARWPDHLLAIQRTKIAFLAKISDLIVGGDPALSARIGLENSDVSNAGHYNTSFLDIITPSTVPGTSPIVYRLRIHHEREAQLLQDSLKGSALTTTIRNTVSAALLEHKRTFIASSSHTASVRNLITSFQPLSTTIRLLKSWIAAHSLSNHIPDQALEIFAAHAFLQPSPWSIPGSATTAFLRCLHFLSRWDWMTEPLIVDLSISQDMPSAQLTEIETTFQAWRKIDPNMNAVSWFIGTSIDKTGTLWTQGARPPRVVAGRVTALAKAAMSLIKSKSNDLRNEDWAGLFISPTTDFDFVIHLKASVVRSSKNAHRGKNEVKFKNIQIQESLDVDSIGHDVVSLFLADLEKVFATSILFFYGQGGRYIAGLWRPNITGQKEWRVRLGYSTVPLASKINGDKEQTKDDAEINKAGILAEIAMLGEGLIEDISMKG